MYKDKDSNLIMVPNSQKGWDVYRYDYVTSALKKNTCGPLEYTQLPYFYLKVGEEWALPGLILSHEKAMNVMFIGAPKTHRGYGTNIP